MYNVLWIDDQYKDPEMIQFAIEADNEGLALEGFSSFEEGFEALVRNLEHFDVILLDGLFFEKKGQETGTEDETGIGMAIAKINELKGRKVFSWFVLSGKDKFTKGENSLLKANKAKCFDKTNPDDVTRLFVEMKAAASQQKDAQIRHEHEEVFSIFTAGYLPSEVEIQVLDLIKDDLPFTRVEIKSMLTNIRSIHESCILSLESIGVIPDSTAPLNSILKHLSGNKTAASNWQPTTYEYQNDAIENLNKWLYFTCGKYIHNLRDENYNGYMISKYAVESMRSGLLELLLWFRKTYKENI
jgi:hypothetical protein